MNKRHVSYPVPSGWAKSIFTADFPVHYLWFSNILFSFPSFPWRSSFLFPGMVCLPGVICHISHEWKKYEIYRLVPYSEKNG